MRLLPGSGAPWTCRRAASGPARSSARTSCCSRSARAAWASSTWPSRPARSSRKVALKVIKPGMDTRQVIARFEAERQALALMDHPNIARVLDAGRDGIRPAVLRHGPGQGRADHQVLRRAAPDAPRSGWSCSSPSARRCSTRIRRASSTATSSRPTCWSRLYDGKPVPKVIDFGVAKATGPAVDRARPCSPASAQIVGTLEYMSPEQAEIDQLDIDTRSDIYSLGVLLYELLTGSTPFTKKDSKTAGLLETLRMIREQEPPKPSTKLSTAEGLPTLATNRGMEPEKLTKLVRGELDWIVMRCLEKDRNRRYETASALAADVERYLHDEPVRACPPSTWYRFRKFARRNRRAVVTATAAALVVVLAVAGLATSTLLIARRQAGDGEGQGSPAARHVLPPDRAGPPRIVRGQPGPRPPIPRGVPGRPARLGVALSHAALPGRAVGPPGQDRSQQPCV